MGAANGCSKCCSTDGERDDPFSMSELKTVDKHHSPFAETSEFPSHAASKALAVLKASDEAFADGTADGGSPPEAGDIDYEDGGKYVGQVRNGQREGEGFWTTTGEQYEGQWKADLQHGVGKHKWSDGRVYDGQFSKGRFSGHGKMVWNTSRGQLMYEGGYEDDLKHGRGRFEWADGRTYDGQWVGGKRHGTAMYTNAQGEQREGQWEEDKWVRWLDSSAPGPQETPKAT